MPLFVGVGHADIMWSIVSSNFEIVCICLVLFAVVLWHDDLFVAPDRMLSFDFQFLSDLPSKAATTATTTTTITIIIIIIILLIIKSQDRGIFPSYS